MARTALAGSVAFLWMLLSSHCVFESLSSLEFFTCDSTTSHASEESHGCDEECCPVEFAAYKAVRQHDLVPHWDLIEVAWDPHFDTEVIPAPTHWVGRPTIAPPNLCQTWQLYSRTALPIRAPAAVS